MNSILFLTWNLAIRPTNGISRQTPGTVFSSTFLSLLPARASHPYLITHRSAVPLLDTRGCYADSLFTVEWQRTLHTSFFSQFPSLSPHSIYLEVTFKLFLLPNAGNTSEYHHTIFLWCWKRSPRLCKALCMQGKQQGEGPGQLLPAS